jgi:hypothetical protein
MLGGPWLVSLFMKVVNAREAANAAAVYSRYTPVGKTFQRNRAGAAANGKTRLRVAHEENNAQP